ncbi:cytochrome c5 family protein [Aestuariibacter halophilus]|uniref:Cytochrome c5 family protein n=1 Tax=Fluctibacter halophilus TaxID=226011 RepID=A0ABS8GBE4_9ALTE|nr:cytochrome c5 family protein [Aestuariibacter halophilus]MCC2617531.1 cytochrome c5 family protein [Aestuariibacter halophilus]
MKLKAFVFALFASLLGFSTIAQDMSEDAIKERIKPVGSVHVAGAQAESAAAAGPRSGADVYNASCVACHGPGVMGAPKLHDAADWSPRMDKGMETLLDHAINGFNAMPPKGTCGNCSDDEIKAAIEYMVEGI